MTAELPDSEQQRLAALRRYYVLDTPPEAAFDRLTRLAAQVMGTPMSAVVLIDEARQWFKSTYGLDIRETPREEAFCLYTIETDEVLVCTDTFLDPRFRENPLVLHPPHIRFYAGARLRTQDGFGIGTLCVLDRVPRPMPGEQERAALQDLAATVVDELELRLANIVAANLSGRLHLSGEILDKVIQALPVGVWIADRSGMILAGNDAAVRIWGGAEHVGVPEYDRYKGWWPETGKRIRSEEWGLARALRDGQTVLHEEVEIESFDGVRKTILNSAAPLRDETGELIGAVVLNEEITERKRAEAELRSARDELERLIESAPLAVVVVNRSRQVERWNPAAERLFGWRADEVVGRPYPLLPPMTDEAVEQRWREFFSGDGARCEEVQRVRKDGTPVDVEVSISPVRDIAGEVTGAIIMLADVSSRKQAEQAIRQSEERYRHLVEDSPNAIAVHDGERLIYVNQAAVQMFGAASAEELLVHSPLSFLEPDFAGMFRQRTAEAVRQNHSLPPICVRLRKLDGTWLYAEATSTRFHYQGAPAVQVIIRDITDQVEAENRIREQERALAESEERFRRAVMDAPIPIMIHAEDGRVLQVNRRWLDLTGYSAEEVNTVDRWLNLAHPEERERVRQYLAGLYGITSRTIDAEWNVCLKDGTSRVWVFSSAPLGYGTDGARVVITMARDETDRRRLEQQLAQAQKMEAIGQLAGGVAHDFNNLLTVVSGYASLLLRSEDVGETARPHLEEIHRAAERGASLTRQLLVFSRKQAIKPKAVDLNGVLRDSEQMLRRLIGEHIDVRTILAPERLLVLVDTGQMIQVLVNLSVNARDAMPAGGVLRIQTGAIEIDDAPPAAYTGLPPGPWVELTVKDTGTGMDAPVLAHIFEPFFTTKPLGSGTGLGLTTVYGIVRQSGGFVFVDSRVGHGSTFRIFLPRQTAAAAEPEAPSEPKSPAEPPAAGTILLVEDDAALRRMAVEILRGGGYQVLEAGSGAEALEVLSRGASVDLLVTDLTMPGMDGVELARQVAASRPGVAVLYMSGYADRVVQRQGPIEDGQLVNKPFSSADLLERVAVALRRRKH